MTDTTMLKPSLQHLRDYDITWYDHYKRAVKWSWALQKAAFYLFVHSIFPWLFESNASAIVFKTCLEMEDACSGEEL
jgi:hypothetical protein